MDAFYVPNSIVFFYSPKIYCRSPGMSRIMAEGAWLGPHGTMPEELRIVLSGNLSSKWSNLSLDLGRTDAVTQCRGTPTNVLSHCRRLAPCALVVDEEFIQRVDPEEFYNAVEFGQSVRVLVELETLSPLAAEHLLRIGCSGYLSRSATPAQACSALCAIVSGELWATRMTVSEVLRSVLRESRHHLTFRESEIIDLVREGLKNDDIAERLFISPQTVRWHLRCLYNKLGIRDHKRATLRAQVLGETSGSVLRPLGHYQASDRPKSGAASG